MRNFMNKLTEKLGKNMERIRTEKGMTQGDIHRDTGLDRAYISRVESGLTNPTIFNLDKIAKALGVKPDELLRY